MANKHGQTDIDEALEEELERERREHVLIDEEKLGMDELEEEHLKRERVPAAPNRQPR